MDSALSPISSISVDSVEDSVEPAVGMVAANLKEEFCINSEKLTIHSKRVSFAIAPRLRRQLFPSRLFPLYPEKSFGLKDKGLGDGEMSPKRYKVLLETP